MKRTQKTPTEMRSVIRMAFNDFYTVARVNVYGRIKKLKQTGRLTDAVRALGYMKSVADNPDGYLSCVGFKDESVISSAIAARCINIDSMLADAGYYLAQTPAENVANGAIGAVTGVLYCKYYSFCVDVMEWQYGQSGDADGFVVTKQLTRDILKSAKYIKARADIVRSNCVLRPVKKLKYSLFR